MTLAFLFFFFSLSLPLFIFFCFVALSFNKIWWALFPVPLILPFLGECVFLCQFTEPAFDVEASWAQPSRVLAALEMEISSRHHLHSCVYILWKGYVCACMFAMVFLFLGACYCFIGCAIFVFVYYQRVWLFIRSRCMLALNFNAYGF